MENQQINRAFAGSLVYREVIMLAEKYVQVFWYRHFDGGYFAVAVQRRSIDDETLRIDRISAPEGQGASLEELAALLQARTGVTADVSVGELVENADEPEELDFDDAA